MKTTCCAVLAAIRLCRGIDGGLAFLFATSGARNVKVIALTPDSGYLELEFQKFFKL